MIFPATIKIPVPHEPVSYRKEAEPDWAYVSRELRRKGVTRHLLWEEYRVGTPRGLGRNTFLLGAGLISG